MTKGDWEEETPPNGHRSAQVGAATLECVDFDASAAYLTVISGGSVGEMIRIVDTALVFGRSRDASFRVNDPGASKEHFRIARNDNDEVVVQDLGSRNGTRVNNDMIEERILSDGDKIRIGANTIFRFSFGDTLEEQFQQQMYEAALRDPLTGLYNRRHLTEQLDNEFVYAQRHRLPLSFVMLDLDHFKQLNDTFGHLCGDAVLRAFGSHLAASVRREDFAARYGGEEFAILCRQTSVDIARLVAERIRTMVEKSSMVPDQPDVKVTISAGVAGIPNPAIGNSTDLIEAADKALYEAKRANRNCVRSYSDLETQEA